LFGESDESIHVLHEAADRHVLHEAADRLAHAALAEVFFARSRTTVTIGWVSDMAGWSFRVLSVIPPGTVDCRRDSW